MMDYMNRFQSYYELTGLSVCLLDGRGKVQKLFPEFETLPFSEHWIACCLLDFQLQKRDKEHPLIFCMEAGFFLGMGQLDEDLYLILGPATPFPPTQEWVHNLCEKYVHPDQMEEYCSRLIRTPVYPYRKFNAALSTVICLYQGHSIDANSILLCNTTFRETPDLDDDLGKAVFQYREEPVYHITMDYEMSIMGAVERGDQEDLKRKLAASPGGDAGMLSRNHQMHLRYRSAIFIALVTRAAIRGGMPSETAFSLCDLYCQQLDGMYLPVDIEAYNYSIAMDFCRRVSEEKYSAGCSPTMRKCQKYITSHLHKTIRAGDVAAFAGISTRSLTTLFRQELGMSLREYINQEKIREAKYLLSYSTFSLAEISHYLGYNSQSYFTQIFRQICGQTPFEYRNDTQ